MIKNTKKVNCVSFLVFQHISTPCFTVITHLYGLGGFFVINKEMIKCVYINVRCKIIRPKDV